MKPALASLLALACLLGAPARAATPEQEKTFVDSYKKALEAADAKALAAFLYTEGAQPDTIEMFKMMQAADPGTKVVSIALVALTPEETADFDKAKEMPDGKQYKMPVKVYKKLVISTETKSADGSSKSDSTSAVAEVKGKLLIPVPVPAKAGAAPAKKPAPAPAPAKKPAK